MCVCPSNFIYRLARSIPLTQNDLQPRCDRCVARNFADCVGLPGDRCRRCKRSKKGCSKRGTHIRHSICCFIVGSTNARTTTSRAGNSIYSTSTVFGRKTPALPSSASSAQTWRPALVGSEIQGHPVDPSKIQGHLSGRRRLYR